jgi:hypothetical protein
LGNAQAENVLEATKYLEHRLLSHDIVVYAPADEAVPVYGMTGHIEGDIRRKEGLPASLATILPNKVTRLPSLDPNAGLEVFEVNKPPLYSFLARDPAASAYRTLLASNGNHRTQRNSSLALLHTG